MKWSRPDKACCLQCKVGGHIYTIRDSVEGLYHLEVRPNKKAKRLKFDSYRDLYVHIAGSNPQEDYEHKMYAKPGHEVTEKEIRSEIELLWTHDPGAGGNLRSYTRDGQDYAVDMITKEVWPYWLPQRISPRFCKERECREWADLYLEERYGQISLFDLSI